MLTVTIHVRTADATLIATHTFCQEVIRIGTRASAHIKFEPNGSVKPLHALLNVTADHVAVVDTGGVLLDDARVRHTAMVPSRSVLTVGDFRLEVLLGADALVAPTVVLTDEGSSIAPGDLTQDVLDHDVAATPSLPLRGRDFDETTTIRQLQDSVAAARQNPPDDPIGRLQLALLICDAETRLADAEDERLRKLHRATLPPCTDFSIRRRGERFVLFYKGGEVDAVTSRGRACQQAWEYHLHPELFESDAADEDAADEDASDESTEPVLLHDLARGLHDMLCSDPVSAEVLWTSLPCRGHVFYALFAAEVLGMFQVTSEGQVDTDVTPMELAIALYRCEAVADLRYADAFQCIPGSSGSTAGTNHGPFALLPSETVAKRVQQARYLTSGFAFRRTPVTNLAADNAPVAPRRCGEAVTVALLTVLYHESVRPSVAQGQSLAHALGQGKPFTEFADLRLDARRGRALTAETLLRRFDFRAFALDAAPVDPENHAIEALAVELHECERVAVDRGWTVIVLDPPRPWIPFVDLPEPAKVGRRNQARFFLERFEVRPAPGA